MRKSFIYFRVLVILSLIKAFNLNFSVLQASNVSFAGDDPVTITIFEEIGLSRSLQPVEVDLSVRANSLAADTVAQKLQDQLSIIDRQCDELGRLPHQVFNIRYIPQKDKFTFSVTFLVTIDANTSNKYDVVFNEGESVPLSDFRVDGEGVGRTISNNYFNIKTDETSGQINTIELRFANRPSFRFRHGPMHYNPDFIILSDWPNDVSYDWKSARHMSGPEYEIEKGPVFFSMKRKQVLPGYNQVMAEVYYRFYSDLPWFIMESKIEALEDFRTFAVRNDQLAFGVDDFTHAGWRTDSIGLHPDHRGGLGRIPLYDHSRSGRHVLGSSLSPFLPWLSYSHDDRGYGVASLRLGWKNQNLLTGGPAPLVNARTVLSDNSGAPYWFRSLVYTPRRANDPAFFNLDAEVISQMAVLIPRGSSYQEKNVYFFFPFNEKTEFQPVDDLYLKLTNPLRVVIDDLNELSPFQDNQ